MTRSNQNQAGKQDKRLSLHPMKFDDALRAILGVRPAKPEAKPAEKVKSKPAP